MAEEPVESLQGQAYAKLRRSIIFLDLKPGERLVLKDLCDRLDMGRTPVRESLVRLQQEGLVRTVPQSGTYVEKIDLEAAESARFVRERLEREVAIEACANATPADIDAIDRCLQLQQKAADAHDQGDFFISDNLMHRTIFDIAGRDVVWGWLAATNADLERYRWLRVSTANLDWDQIVQEHRQIRDAIMRHDPMDTGYLISKHLHMMFSDQVKVVAAFPEYFKTEN